ncbi:MAG: calcium-binding EGF-like domain-containing protein [Bacteroidetes bacterium]|nr:calcium-binding EGF-like domain-containing protein [Bacteroidota bacterium]
MKFWKNTLLTAFAFIGISSTVLYTACVKDACADLNCQNNGTCTDGFCHCPTGYEGTECELLAADRFQGLYYGTSVISTYPTDVIPTLYDTVAIFMTPEPNRVGVVRQNDRQGSNPRDTVYGFINGRYIDIDSVVKGKDRRYYTVELKANGLTYKSEELLDVDTTIQKTEITFMGTRAYKFQTQ